jgi:hypothetical protein
MDMSAALLSAPVVEAPPRPSVPALPPQRDRMDTTPPTKRGKPPIALIGAVVALALVVAGGVFFVVKSRVAPTAAESAQPSATAPVATAAPVPTAPPAATTAAPTGAPTPPEAPTAPAPAPEAPAVAAPAAPAAPTPPPAAAAPQPQKAAPAGGTSSLDAMKAAMKPAGATPTPEKPEIKGTTDKGTKVVLSEEPAAAPAAPAAEAPADEAPKPPFDTAAAKAALGAAAGNAASCKKNDGPTGSGKVTVTFSPSGRVTSANVTEGPFGGTPVGGCIAKLFRGAKVPAFSGDPVTVAKGFSIPE